MYGSKVVHKYEQIVMQIFMPVIDRDYKKVINVDVEIEIMLIAMLVPIFLIGYDVLWSRYMRTVCFLCKLVSCRMRVL